jgi:hypothetical protein
MPKAELASPMLEKYLVLKGVPHPSQKGKLQNAHSSKSPKSMQFMPLPAPIPLRTRLHLPPTPAATPQTPRSCTPNSAAPDSKSAILFNLQNPAREGSCNLTKSRRRRGGAEYRGCGPPRETDFRRDTTEGFFERGGVSAL